MSSQTKFNGSNIMRPFGFGNNKGSWEVQKFVVKAITNEKFQKSIEQF